MRIKIVTNITDEIISALNQLLLQLDTTFEELQSKEYLEQMINSNNTILFIAEEDGIIVGTLSLIIYRTPLGQKAWIEDVVTDKNVRGKGIGYKLLNAALEYAKNKGLKKVDLTSGNDKFAAHQLYKKIGFKHRDSTLFRYEIS